MVNQTTGIIQKYNLKVGNEKWNVFLKCCSLNTTERVQKKLVRIPGGEMEEIIERQFELLCHTKPEVVTHRMDLEISPMQLHKSSRSKCFKYHLILQRRYNEKRKENL